MRQPPSDRRLRFRDGGRVDQTKEEEEEKEDGEIQPLTASGRDNEESLLRALCLPGLYHPVPHPLGL